MGEKVESREKAEVEQVVRFKSSSTNKLNIVTDSAIGTKGFNILRLSFCDYLRCLAVPETPDSL